MKTIKRAVNLSLVSFLILFGFYSCATKSAFIHSTIVPGAEGNINVSQDKNKNYQVKINIRNLAEPDRLDPPRKTYLIWMETNEHSAKNLGQLKISTGGISKNLKASFQTVTPEKPHKIFITAEDDGDIQFPGAQIVLSTGNL